MSVELDAQDLLAITDAIERLRELTNALADIGPYSFGSIKMWCDGTPLGEIDYSAEELVFKPY